MKEDRGLSPIHCFITFLGFDCVEHCFDCMLTTENGVFTKKTQKIGKYPEISTKNPEILGKIKKNQPTRLIHLIILSMAIDIQYFLKF